MRKVLLLFFLVFASGGAGAAVDAAEHGGGTRFRVETEDLVLEWTELPDSTEVAAVTAKAADVYRSVVDLLGMRPEGKVTIVLGGSAEKHGGKREYPRVDFMGRVLLFKFVPDYNNYFTALAHELVHVFRFHRRMGADWFFEEGFAEFVALRADSPLAGFPWFDYPVTVVAGQWLAEGEDIPLGLLRERHGELNLKCGAQSYALRAAFFDWLGRTFGDAAVFEAANEANPGASEDYERIFGKPFAQLEAEWRRSLLAEFGGIHNGSALARKYRTESPIKYQKVCSEGEDF